MSTSEGNGEGDGARGVPLSAESVRSGALGVPVPEYDRDAVTSGVVHFGVGAFHRSHQAMFHDRILALGSASEWALCGVGVMGPDERMRDALRAQDNLFTLVEKHPDGRREARVIGSIIAYFLAADDTEAVIEKLAAETTRIVSLTITEGGYNLDDATGRFDAEQPDVVHDLEAGVTPATVFGIVVEGLRRRRDRGLAPFTIMSCDNLPGNGHLAKEVFTAFARLRDPELGAYVEREVAFPNSMVDRITPATTDEDRAEVLARFGIEDRWPVVCEDFAQWVLEDRFSAGRPPYEQVGVQVVDDVEPYELMKLRLLNGGHALLGYLGTLCGHRWVHEAAQDPLLRAVLRGYMDEEARPTLPVVEGVDLDEYCDSLLERFSNPHVADTLARVSSSGSDKLPKFLIPVIRAQLEAGGDLRRAATVVAAFARYAEGVDDEGRPIEVVDRLADELAQRAGRWRSEPDAFLADRRLFGSLGEEPRFVDAFRSALESLHERGTRATLRDLVEAGVS